MLNTYILTYKGKRYSVRANSYENALKALMRIVEPNTRVKPVQDAGERVSPMIYKKLREYGYNENDWKDWSADQKREVVARHTANQNKATPKEEKPAATASTTQGSESKEQPKANTQEQEKTAGNAETAAQSTTSESNKEFDDSVREYNDKLKQKFGKFLEGKEIPEPKQELAIPQGKALWQLIKMGAPVTYEDVHNHPAIKRAKKNLSEKLGAINVNGIGENETINDNSEEREKLRQETAKKILSRGSIRTYKDESGKKHTVFDGPVNRDYRAEIVIGPPAAGKSSVIVDRVSKNTGSVILDSDEVKKLLPEFDDGNGAGIVHKESADDILEKRIIPEFYKGGSKEGTNLVIPIVGKKPRAALQYLKNLKDAGYKVHLSFNEVTPDESIRRSTTRFFEESRFLDPDYIESVGESPAKTYDTLKESAPFDSFTRYNNMVSFGEPAKKVERVDGSGNEIPWEDWQ